GQYLAGEFVEEWDLDGLFTQLEQLYPVAIQPEDLDPNALERTALIGDLRDDVVKAYDEREQELGQELMRALERFVLLQIIDERWREHLHDMDYLREGIHLRGFAQIDPLVAYKNEAFEMFTALINGIWEEFARYIFHVDVEVQGPDGEALPEAAGAGPGLRALQYSGGVDADQPSALAAARAQAGAVAAGAGGVGAAMPGLAADYGEPVLPGAEDEVVRTVEPRRLDEHEQIGRNDPCWCGSGLKFKKCHGQ
ncbi:MAG TPA: SEC-C metal-binding domain-containing protein, partial [Thermoleophilaceae bacterium]|nr:SEC-C metal-binding domain-containing protein [Thermoleophilaceae bacterium]